MQRRHGDVLSNSRYTWRALFRIIEHLLVIHASVVSVGHICDPPGAQHILSVCMTMRHVYSSTSCHVTRYTAGRRRLRVIFITR